MLRKKCGPLAPDTSDKHKRFVRITGGSLDINGCVKHQFALGGHTFDHLCFVIADGPAIPADGIIGQDILSAQGINILTIESTVQLQGFEVTIKNWKTETTRSVQQELDAVPDPTFEGISVRLTAVCTVPPMSKVICWGKVTT